MSRLATVITLMCALWVHAEESTVTGFLNKSVETGDGARKYVLYVPPAYDPAKAWPMIVFLHGAGERGDDGLIQSEVGLGAAIRRDVTRFPALVLMPQCPKDRFWDVAIPAIEGAMAQTQADYNVDRERVYLTGLSMGGYMTWIWGALKTDTFAAFMPICGGGDLGDIQRLLGAKKTAVDFGALEDRVAKLATVPIWAFHGAKDSVVPVVRSQEMVQRVKAAGGAVKYTEYPETDHNSWDAAYADEDAIAWLFQQRLEK